MTILSVNINKVATIRNSRGGNLPDVLKAAVKCEEFGAQGITVHPRPDERHIRYQDARDLKPLLTTEFNIEGNPIPSFVDLVCEVLPHQVTLVPDADLALSLVFERGAFPEADVDRETALAYLHRDAITLPDLPKGYVTIVYEGLPLGFVKNLGNRCNNLYPQSRRIRMNIR